jgi:(R,R)-butanediol dehydrogenase / meso-butanediol dehydrogenase / diacetyl reductase
MRAVVYNAAHDVTIAEVPEPKTGEGQVRIQVGYNGICGTDVHEYYAGPILIPTEPHPLTGRMLPVVLGHEFAGTIVEVGPGVTGLAEGDRVAVEPVYRCDECASCRAGRYNVCAKVGFHGLSTDGGMAEYTVVDARMAHHLPDEVSTELGALVEPMSVAYHAAKHGAVSPDGTAVVFGAGPIGIGLWYALRGQGVTDVLVVEPSPVRRTSIERLGARTLDPTTTDVPAFVADHTHGRGADATYDAAGVQPAVEAALACLGASRTMVSVAHLRATARDATAAAGDAGGPDPGNALLHRRGLPGRDRADGARPLRHHRLGGDHRNERRGGRGVRGTARGTEDEGAARSEPVTLAASRARCWPGRWSSPRGWRGALDRTRVRSPGSARRACPAR